MPKCVTAPLKCNLEVNLGGYKKFFWAPKST